MKIKEVNHSVIVGIFITIGVLIFVAAIFVLGGQQKTFVKSFTITAVFNDINGLQAGNNVWLFGVKIGIIKKVAFYGQKEVEVTMSIEKEAQSRIHKDASAKISTDGFIGNKIIVLDAGSQAAPQVQDGDHINMAATSNTDEMLAVLQQNNKNLLEITDNIKAVSKKLADGQGSIGQLLNDTSMAYEIKIAVAHFKNVSEKSEEVIADVQQFSAQLNKPGSLANEFVTDTSVFNNIRSTVDRLNNASLNLNNASLKIYDVTDSLQKASESLNDTKKPVGMILNDEAVAQNLRMMIKNLESSSNNLNEDLEAVQHNFLLRGFFKKKEKEQQAQ
jgi:phospholipid/cholesterol/gamma-HCH transport system substrate-binding protein